MAVEELLVELADDHDLGRVVPVSGAEDMDRTGRSHCEYELGVEVAATLRAGPFHAAIGSLRQVGEAMDGLHGHGKPSSFLTIGQASTDEV